MLSCHCSRSRSNGPGDFEISTLLLCAVLQEQIRSIHCDGTDQSESVWSILEALHREKGEELGSQIPGLLDQLHGRRQFRIPESKYSRDQWGAEGVISPLNFIFP